MQSQNELRAVEESRAWGKSLRSSVPRSALAIWKAPTDRIDPAKLIESQSKNRIPELLPLRYERMSASPFTFFRGSALVMANDLSEQPSTGLTVQACGDCHISNFGAYASPERRLVFDINDFDETLPGPWEWDVKRMAASVEICGRDRNFSKKERRNCVLECARAYRETMLKLANMSNLDVWYAQVDLDEPLRQLAETAPKHMSNEARKALQNSHKKDRLRAFSKLTEETNGVRQIISDPPCIVPLRNLDNPKREKAAERVILKMLDDYEKTLDPDKRHLFNEYSYVDIARKVVGVGSVGTRCWIAVFIGRDESDPLVLQIKEANESVLERYLGKSSCKQHGQRVVQGQRLMQTSSDILLGWVRGKNLEGEDCDFYIRQLWDWKSSADLDSVIPRGLELYSRLCACTLARSHARSGNRFAIAGYLGESTRFDEAIVEFAAAYADQNEKDYATFMQAISDGKLR